MFPKLALRLATNDTRKFVARNIGSTAVVLNKLDPIQQLFVDKTREYFKKKSVAKGGLVDSSPENVKALNDEIEKINRQYGASGQNFDEFPKFQFQEPKLDGINLAQESK